MATATNPESDRAPGVVLLGAFYARDTVSVARDLLGCLLVSTSRGVVTAGRIVEVEAYVGPDDPACHSFGWRRTERVEAMYAPPGTAYVYRSYGIHWCFNVVTEREGFPAAVLVRSLEPAAGVRAMQRRRGVQNPRLLCAGPGRLCEALGITDRHNHLPLAGERLVIKRETPPSVVDVGSGPRVGVSKAGEWPLRFFERGSPWLSR